MGTGDCQLLRQFDASLGACFGIIFMVSTILAAYPHKSRHDMTWEGPGRQKPALTHAHVWSTFAENYKLGGRQRKDTNI